MSYAEDQARRQAELQRQGAGTTTGQVVALSWVPALVTVDLGGVQQAMPWDGPPPWVGDRVRVSYSGGLPVCALIEGAPHGTVQSVTSGLVTLVGDDGFTYAGYAFVNGDSLAAGQRVAIDHARRFIIGRLSTDVTPDPGGGGGGGGGSGSAWFNPAWSGNWRAGAFAGDVAQISDSRTAAYGYGTQIADTVPDGASVTRAELHLVQDWDEVPGVPSSMGWHGQNGRPGSFGDGGIGGLISVPGGSRAVDIRAFADLFKTGGALGVGFRSANGWRQYSAAPTSGRIYMEWSS